MAELETLAAANTPGDEDDTKTNADHAMPNVRRPMSDSGRDSDIDSESEDENEVKAQIEALEAELYSNPSNYESHVQYIKVLRRQGDIEKLRLARESMSSLFPLSSEMWQEWAKDEVTVGSSEEVLPSVENVYERGVADYLETAFAQKLVHSIISDQTLSYAKWRIAEFPASVPLWCDYLTFIQEYDPAVRGCTVAGISKARNIFERALTAAGLHVAEGYKIWEMFREFEQAIFLTIAENDSGAKEKQIQRLRNLFHRQLSIPLMELEPTLVAYKEWEANIRGTADVNGRDVNGVSSHVMSGYQKALQMLNARAHFEELILKRDADPELLEGFMAYLKFEHSYGDPARIQILYERAVARFPVASEIWMQYTQYLDKTFKTARIVRDTYYRATRNCTWVGELWTHYLLSLERSCCAAEQLSTVFERALQCTFSSSDEYLDIFLTRVDGLRRRTSASVEPEGGLNHAVIRDIFQRASDCLSRQLKNADGLLLLHSYWAHLEIKLGKDLVAARGVWESLLKISGSTLEAWQGYIAMEIELGYINEARFLYKRCYSRRFPGTGSEDICHSWVRFEREHGSLEDLDVAVQKVTPRLQELHLFRLQQESKNVVAATNERGNSSMNNPHEKRKLSTGSAGGESVSKRQKIIAEKSNKTKKFDSNQARHSAEPRKASELDDNITENSSSKEISYKFSKNVVPFDDQCTAFISNLGLEATDTDLRSFFADVGGVVAIRILKDKFTKKSRGLAYADFSDDAHLAAALEKNKQFLFGKKLSILKSQPQQGRKKAVAGHKNRPEQNAGKMDAKEAPRGQSESQLETRQPTNSTSDVQLKGKNTFAVPRNVKPLGWTTTGRPKSEESSKGVGDQNPISNEEFRKMFLKA